MLGVKNTETPVKDKNINLSFHKYKKKDNRKVNIERWSDYKSIRGGAQNLEKQW